MPIKHSELFFFLSSLYLHSIQLLILIITKLIEETTFNPTQETTLGITWRTTEITTEKENLETIWILENPELTTITADCDNILFYYLFGA